MNKMFRFGMICGRFQTFHKGHKKLIDTALTLCDNVIVIVGSADKKGTVRNPFSASLRTAMIESVYKDEERVIVKTLDDLSDENDISTQWGEYLLNFVNKETVEKCNLNVDFMIYGNDESRSSWFTKEQISNISEFIVKRDNISATKVRELMAKNLKAEWEEYVDDACKPFYNLMREELLKIDYYKDIAN